MAKEINLDLDLYSFNKQAMSQLPVLDLIQYNIATENVYKDLCKENKKYWMLLNNERKDFTIFAFVNDTIEDRKKFLSEFRETINNRGQLVDIDKLEDSINYEIWVRDPATRENFLYHFFDYSEGVIEI